MCQKNAGKNIIVRLFLIGLIFTAQFFMAADPVSAARKHENAGIFTFNNVVELAEKSAQKPYVENPGEGLPDLLRDISYNQWRDIRYRKEKALWYNENIPFKIEFFHPGFLYNRPVKINIVDDSKVLPFNYSPELFDYGKNDFGERIPGGIGFAGLRIRYPINTRKYLDEFAVFLGATYLRAVAKEQLYGLSARGLAVNTAEANGEEFPVFSEFWIVKPARSDRSIVLYALLDSYSMTGAYKYVITPGEITRMAVDSVIFPREKIQKIGIAPITSMFFYGENTYSQRFKDFRPEVHDSDGLSIVSETGEWIWRPLTNPKHLLVNAFLVGSPEAFGLFQRDLDFDHYQDLETWYERRPSLWVTPTGNWGDGHLELVQIPTNTEFNDNIVAYWVLDTSPEPGVPLRFSYILEWCSSRDKIPPGAYVTATRVINYSKKHVMRFVIDFEGAKISSFPPDSAITAEISVNEPYRIWDRHVQKNTITGGWRVLFDIGLETGFLEELKAILPEKRPVGELRLFLKYGDRALSETWTYTVQPAMIEQ
ncbi:MAG: glucan biosynthesis protein G [Candidatus Omnitrophota bacterium]